MNWISVEKRLPNDEIGKIHKVLACSKNGYVGISILKNNIWISLETHSPLLDSGDDFEVTHWMELPKPKKSHRLRYAFLDIILSIHSKEG